MKNTDINSEYVADLLHNTRVMRNYCSGHSPNLLALGIEIGSLYTKLDQLLTDLDKQEKIEQCAFGKNYNSLGDCIVKKQNHEEDEQDEDEYDEDECKLLYLERENQAYKTENLLYTSKLEKIENQNKKLSHSLFELQDLIMRLLRFKKIDEVEVSNIVNVLRMTGIDDSDLKVIALCSKEDLKGKSDDELPY